MKLLTLDPQLSELFKQRMLTQGWVISHQDAGQTHLVGWGYEITWQKNQSSITLRYFDKQGIATAFLEISQDVASDIQALLHELECHD